MPDRTNPTSKKERIREMINKGIAPGLISDELNTTVEYVYKEKGKLKKEGLLVTHQSLSASNGERNVFVIKDKPGLTEDIRFSPALGTGHSNYERGEYSISPLGDEKLKSTYSAFNINKGPIAVITEFGVHPAIAVNEYNRFLNIKSRDPFELQKQIVSMISNPSPEVKSIIDKSQNELLTNDELIKLFNFRVESYASWKFRNAFHNPSVEIPKGLERPVCPNCLVPQSGVIFDRATNRGYFTWRLIAGAPCPSCAAYEWTKRIV